MELYLARDEGIKKLLLTFPTTFAQVRDAVRDLEELMREDPAEQYQREMGGLA